MDPGTNVDLLRFARGDQREVRALVPAWATVAITLGASLIAVTGTLLGAWLQERRATSRAEAEARERRIRDGADIIARVQLLLSDGDPDRLGINVRRDAPFEALNPLQDEWRQTLRPALAAFALADPSPDVRDLGRRLEVAASNALIAAGWMLHDLTRPTEGGSRESRTRAKSDHAEARQLAELLMGSIRGEPPATDGA